MQIPASLLGSQCENGENHPCFTWDAEALRGLDVGPWRIHRVAEVRLGQIPPGLGGSLLLQILKSIPQREYSRTSLGDYTEL